MKGLFFGVAVERLSELIPGEAEERAPETPKNSDAMPASGE